MIPTENKNTIHFKQRLLPNCLPHDLEIVTVNGGESTSKYHTPLAVAQFTGKQKKIKSGYFIATPRIVVPDDFRYGPKHVAFIDGIIKNLLCLTVIYGNNNITRLFKY